MKIYGTTGRPSKEHYCNYDCPLCGDMFIETFEDGHLTDKWHCRGVTDPDCPNANKLFGPPRFVAEVEEIG